ncbi:MAG: asparagine synthase (glutamine-hydrolyzing) [Thermoanaerobaculia bacterium]|nr:asparagine synthase (glutamine-hydrolyzing) [Thermoanaerobaculia bacterium]
MCGINGILRLASDAPPPDREELRNTREAMASRGPDGTGEWLSPHGDLALGHRRLAILDLTPSGAQPMSTPDGRFTVVYNGEIYNHRELRCELEAAGVAFRTASDTEVLLQLAAREGLAGIGRLRGMYAFALWDEVEKSLLLARDPFGIKPLYYTAERGTLRFASQVKALTAGGAVRERIDPAALAAFLLWGSVPEPRTIQVGVRAVPAGHAVRVAGGRVGEPERIPIAALGESLLPAEALAASVAAHLVSDVPLAIFLSSGIDSCLVAALARRAATELLVEPPVAFTAAFEGWEGQARDEAPLAREVARKLGLRHVERRLGRRDVALLWGSALAAMDQPSIDGFNTFLVAWLAHEEGIKVALSGLGGDELCGSYPSFADVPRWAHGAARLASLPGVAATWPSLARRLRPAQPKLAGLLAQGPSLPGAYYLRRGLFLPEELRALLGPETASAALEQIAPVALAASRLAEPRPDGGRAADDWTSVQALEVSLYLRHQLLRDSDWAAMASSVELRVPFVDVALWSSFAARGFEPARSRGKAALARTVAPELPAAVFTRPKTGFQVLGPEAAGRPLTWGASSRQLAIEVLRAWNVDLPTPEAA